MRLHFEIIGKEIKKGTVIDMKKKYEIPEIDVSALITENFLCYSYDEGGEGDNFISWDPFA